MDDEEAADRYDPVGQYGRGSEADKTGVVGRARRGRQVMDASEVENNEKDRSSI